MSDEKVNQPCDRCATPINGSRGDTFTAGFYDVREGGCWAKYANPGELVICDFCMQHDPRYVADYYPCAVIGCKQCKQ